MPVSDSTPSYVSKNAVIRGVITALLRGEWQASDHFTESSACDKFGVSRPSVREAFLELQSLGLIELRRNCGAIVHPFGPGDLLEIYHLRTLLETDAARLAAGNMPVNLIETMIADFRKIEARGGVDPEWRHDRQLHESIALHSGSRRLATEIRRYGALIQTIREIVGEQNLGIHSTTTEEHLAILEALKSGNSRSASKAVRTHLNQASESAVIVMEALRSIP